MVSHRSDPDVRGDEGLSAVPAWGVGRCANMDEEGGEGTGRRDRLSTLMPIAAKHGKEGPVRRSCRHTRVEPQHRVRRRSKINCARGSPGCAVGPYHHHQRATLFSAALPVPQLLIAARRDWRCHDLDLVQRPQPASGVKVAEGAFTGPQMDRLGHCGRTGNRVTDELIAIVGSRTDRTISAIKSGGANDGTERQLPPPSGRPGSSVPPPSASER